jgi:RNA polymerase sigma-70 factor, ECF subfamily
MQASHNFAPAPQRRLGVRSERLVRDISCVMLNTGRADEPEINLEDVRLVRQMAAGDTAALGKFYDRWVDKVHASVIAIVRSPQDAEEVVDDCFWQAWTRASQFDVSRGQVRAWIFNIARSRALDRLKAVNRRREDDLDSVGANVLATDPDAENRLDEAQRATTLTSALDGLPAAQRVAVEMAYYGGLSQAEIAESIGEPLGTVKTRIRLGMQKLRETLKPVAGMTS